MIFVNLTVASRCGDSKADRRDEFLLNKHANEKEREIGYVNVSYLLFTFQTNIPFYFHRISEMIYRRCLLLLFRYIYDREASKRVYVTRGTIDTFSIRRERTICSFSKRNGISSSSVIIVLLLIVNLAFLSTVKDR